MTSHINCVLFDYLNYDSIQNLVLVSKKHSCFLGCISLDIVVDFILQKLDKNNIKKIQDIYAKSYLITLFYSINKAFEMSVRTNCYYIVKITYQWIQEYKYYTLNKKNYITECQPDYMMQNSDKLSTFERYCCSYAARNNNFDLVIYLNQLGFYWNVDILMFAVYFNNISVFEYIKSKNHKISPDIYNYAKIIKNDYILNWMNNNYYLLTY